MQSIEYATESVYCILRCSLLRGPAPSDWFSLLDKATHLALCSIIHPHYSLLYSTLDTFLHSTLDTFLHRHHTDLWCTLPHTWLYSLSHCSLWYSTHYFTLYRIVTSSSFPCHRHLPWSQLIILSSISRDETYSVSFLLIFISCDMVT